MSILIATVPLIAIPPALALGAVQAMALVSALGAVVMLPVVWATGQWFDPFPLGAPEFALIAAATAHACAYAGYVWLASRSGAVFAGQTGYIVTGTGVLRAMVIRGERLAPTVRVALAVMLAGLARVQPRPSLRRSI
jgi:hypothetical protein